EWVGRSSLTLRPHALAVPVADHGGMADLVSGLLGRRDSLLHYPRYPFLTTRPPQHADQRGRRARVVREHGPRPPRHRRSPAERSRRTDRRRDGVCRRRCLVLLPARPGAFLERAHRSEEHTSELQSLAYLVCRLLLEKKNESAFSYARIP